MRRVFGMIVTGLMLAVPQVAQAQTSSEQLARTASGIVFGVLVLIAIFGIAALATLSSNSGRGHPQVGSTDWPPREGQEIDLANSTLKCTTPDF